MNQTITTFENPVLTSHNSSWLFYWMFSVVNMIAPNGPPVRCPIWNVFVRWKAEQEGYEAHRVLNENKKSKMISNAAVILF